MKIQRAKIDDVPALAAMSVQLWPENSMDEMLQEFDELSRREDVALFLAWDEKKSVGFAQCQLRRDYVEGTQTSPVGYLEAIYVEESHRKQGCARALLGACEDWAKEMGCTEFASDCELHNTQSLRFHLSVGFEEAGRIICFTKKLEREITR